jgi:DNA-binding response OmpR family regulator
MDIFMPGIDGLEATRQIRALENKGFTSTQPVPVLALSANARRDDQKASLAAGMDGYLAKPFDRADLEQAIHRLALARRRLISRSPVMLSVFVDGGILSGDDKRRLGLLFVAMNEPATHSASDTSTSDGPQGHADDGAVPRDQAGKSGQPAVLPHG